MIHGDFNLKLTIFNEEDLTEPPQLFSKPYHCFQKDNSVTNMLREIAKSLVEQADAMDNMASLYKERMT